MRRTPAKGTNQQPKEELMKHFVLFAFIFSLLLPGCNYTVGNIELKGKVIDEHTKTAIPNMSVTVEAVYQGYHKSKKIYVGDFKTDSSGCFTYRLRKVKNMVLYNFCIQGDEEYDQSNKILGLTELDIYGKFLEFEANKIVDLTMKINRESKTPFRDTLTVSWRTDGVEGETFYPFTIKNYQINSENGLRWIGGDVKSEVKTKVFADKNTVIHWELFRNGMHKHIIDTIFCIRTAANSVSLTY